MKRVSVRRHRQSGQTIIEFALGGATYLLLLLAAIDFAYAVFSYNEVASAAREAVRYAIVHGPNSPSPATTAQIQQAAINAAVGVPLATSNVTVSWSSDARLSSQKDAQVTISYNYHLLTMPVSFTLTSKSQMLASQ